MCMSWHYLVIYHFSKLTKTGRGSYFAFEPIVNKQAMYLHWCLIKSCGTIKRVKTCLQTHTCVDCSYLVRFLRNMSWIRGCVYCSSPDLLMDVTLNLWSKMCRSIVHLVLQKNVFYAVPVVALNNAMWVHPMRSATKPLHLRASGRARCCWLVQETHSMQLDSKTNWKVDLKMMFTMGHSVVFLQGRKI